MAHPLILEVGSPVLLPTRGKYPSRLRREQGGKWWGVSLQRNVIHLSVREGTMAQCTMANRKHAQRNNEGSGTSW